MKEQEPSNIKETPDQKILNEIIQEWNAGAGAGVVTPTILNMLRKLILAYGEKVTVDGAREALNSLSETALEIKKDLETKQGK